MGDQTVGAASLRLRKRAHTLGTWRPGLTVVPIAVERDCVAKVVDVRLLVLYVIFCQCIPKVLVLEPLCLLVPVWVDDGRALVEAQPIGQPGQPVLALERLVLFALCLHGWVVGRLLGRGREPDGRAGQARRLGQAAVPRLALDPAGRGEKGGRLSC